MSGRVFIELCTTAQFGSVRANQSKLLVFDLLIEEGSMYVRVCFVYFV